MATLPRTPNSAHLDELLIAEPLALRLAVHTAMPAFWLLQPLWVVQATEPTAVPDLCPQVKRALELQERPQDVTSPVPMRSPAPQVSQYGRSFLMAMLGNVPENIAPEETLLPMCKVYVCLEGALLRAFQ